MPIVEFHEPQTFAGIPLVEVPIAGDEAALIGVLALIIADLCVCPVADNLTVLTPLVRLEAA